MKYVPAHIKAIRLLKALRKQLEAMNCSPAHAASWVEPASKITKLRLRQVDKVIAAIEEENSP